jgi:hypothetical protein
MYLSSLLCVGREIEAVFFENKIFFLSNENGIFVMLLLEIFTQELSMRSVIMKNERKRKKKRELFLYSKMTCDEFRK